MCGILTYINKNPAPETVFSAWQSLENRGPDAFDSWTNGNVNLYHTRLSIIDLSEKGNQPMETDRWVLVYNGEIYNYQDMRTKISPRAWKSHNDTETLLFYIDQFGIDRAVNDAIGMFAFSAYDKIYKKLYLYVDPYGIKPLFWVKTEHFFACASSPAALTYLNPTWKLDRFALFDMLALGGTKEPLFEGIKRIPGGSYVTYDLNTDVVSRGTWYERKEHKCTEGDLMDVVKESIQMTKVADVPAYIFLSGGIDSTIIASQCQYYNAVHLKSPEEQYAKEVATKYNNQLKFVEPVNYSASECLEDYVRQSGDCSMAALQPYIVSKEVAKLCKIAISANGADELTFGYNRMLDDVSESQFRHIIRKMPHSWGDYIDYKTTRELELKTYVEYDLNKTLDFSSMCHSLEVRVPYLNKSVVEVALSLPRNKHLNGYGPKSILKSFLKSEGFSNEFITRPKIGFSLHTEPSDYAKLKVDGLKLLRETLNINLHFYSARDSRYFEASAAAFLCFWNVWKHKIII